MNYAFASDESNLFQSVNNTAPYTDSTTWGFYAGLLATIITLDAAKNGFDSVQNDIRWKIMFGSRDRGFVGKKQSKLYFFFGSDHGILTAEYDFMLNDGGYTYTFSSLNEGTLFFEFKNKTDRYEPLDPDDFTVGYQTFMSMLVKQ